MGVVVSGGVIVCMMFILMVLGQPVCSLGFLSAGSDGYKRTVAV